MVGIDFTCLILFLYHLIITLAARWPSGWSISQLTHWLAQLHEDPRFDSWALILYELIEPHGCWTFYWRCLSLAVYALTSKIPHQWSIFVRQGVDSKHCHSIITSASSSWSYLVKGLYYNSKLTVSRHTIHALLRCSFWKLTYHKFKVLSCWYVVIL